MARTLQFEPQLLDVRSARDLIPALDSAASRRVGAVVVAVDALIQAHRYEVVDALTKRRLPASSRDREFAEAGGLLSYGVHYADSYHRAAAYVDKILKGARPGDLPIEQPTRLELVINLKTAKALGLKIPDSLLLRADEVIQ